MTAPRRTDLKRILQHIRNADKAWCWPDGSGDSKWIAIGHMAEAADSCLPEHVDVAEELRVERLVMMEDFSYDPDFASIVDRISSLK